MKHKNKGIKIFFLILFFLALFFSFAQAVENQYPTVPGAKTPGPGTNFSETIKYIFNLSMLIGALLVLGVLVWSGFRYLTSGNNPAVTSDVKKKMYSALLGMLILLSAYLILNTINPGFVNISLPFILSGPTTPTSTAPITPIVSKNFQEIPLGTIIEDLLAGNSSTTAHPGLKCYEYDPATGDTIDVNNDGKIDGNDSHNYNDFYCVGLINKAFEKKVENFLKEISGLKTFLAGKCSCSNCEKYQTAYYNSVSVCRTYPCGVSNNCGSITCCEQHCSCCGNARGTDLGCPKSDPCKPNRMEIDCKRQELQQLIDGSELIENATSLCPSAYDPDKDPVKNPQTTFLTLKEVANRTGGFHLAFLDGLASLKEAERLMKSPYGERFTMAEFIDLKQKNKDIGITPFKGYDPITLDYCNEFNCTKTNNQAICNECSVNSEKRMCKIRGTQESYIHDGDGATFYFNEEYKNYKENSSPSGEKCTIDPNTGLMGAAGGRNVLGQDGKLINIGMIPIGETVDDAENFATKMLALYNFLWDNYQKTIDAAQNLVDSPDDCKCSNCSSGSACRTNPCCGNCSCPNPPYCVSCPNCTLPYTDQQKENLSDATMLAWKTEYDYCTHYPYYVPDMVRRINICPFEEIDQEMKNINNKDALASDYRCCDYSTSTTGEIIAELATSTSWTAISKVISRWVTTDRGRPLERPYATTTIKIIYPELPGYLQKIEIIYKKMEDLFNGRNLEKDDPNRCQILDKLSVSRKKMDNCFTGFGTTLKEGMTKMRTFSCQSGLDLVYLGKLIILPDFSYSGCYPFTSQYLSKTGKTACLKNKDGTVCQKEISNLMDNYYCCEGK
ncbi:MAG: hypothetical protein E4H47_00200 [Parcubacteria group bacterium]|nr:MAG: hypothetical protein E4H47_00200 [Parcubacteria group bacterium]